MAMNIRTVEQLALLPPDSFYVTVNGRFVDWKLLHEGSVFSVHFRLCGGKGGISMFFFFFLHIDS